MAEKTRLEVKKGDLMPPRNFRKAPESRPGERARRVLAVVAKLSLVAAFLGTATFAGVLHYFGRDLPSVRSLHDYSPPQTTRVVDRSGKLIGEIFDERRTIVPIERIPRAMVLSVLAAEDADFYFHEGFDYKGIARAILKDAPSGRKTGASTITQQVVKLLLLSPERTLARKIRELILARRLEQELSKDEILFLYLNHINFGSGRNGVQEAARYYFGKDVDHLTLAEASYIAGIPQSPSRLDPYRNPEAAKNRQAYVLRQLEEKRETHWPDLSLDEILAAKEHTPELAGRDTRPEHAPEIMAHARTILRDLIGAEALKHGGFTVHTTIDLDLQHATRAAVREGLHEADARQARVGPLPMPKGKQAKSPVPRVDQLGFGKSYEAEVVGHQRNPDRIVFDVGGHEVVVPLVGAHRYNPKELPLEEFAPVGARTRVSLVERGDEGTPARGRIERGPQAAVVVLDVRTREVRALVGAYEGTSGFDRATLARRQPGSTFKPIVYAEGIRARKFTAASRILDAPAVYEQWRPQNSEPWFEGPVPMRTAIARSINLVAIRVMESVGPEAVVRLARDLGVESPLEPTLALSLGASELTPLELAGAYATFAGGGRYEAPRLIRAVEGPDGKRVALPPPPPGRDVLTPSEAYIVTSLLTSVVTEGTGKGAQALGRPIAGKTGTSNESRDAWFAGYSADTVAVAWVGFDDRRSLGKKESGGRTALPIFVKTMKAAEKSVPPRSFARPDDIEVVAIDPGSGLRAYGGMDDAVDEVFLLGTAPTQEARRRDVADTSTLLMEEFEP
jgi:penicillin-binding protein 1A